MSDQPTFYQKHQIDKQRQAKWEQMLAHLCDEYDLGPLSDLSDDRRQELEGELEDHVDQWNETEPVSGHRPSTPFQKMLAEHHELGEQLLDILDDENPDIPDPEDEDSLP